jgi:hypothetical protein
MRSGMYKPPLGARPLRTACEADTVTDTGAGRMRVRGEEGIHIQNTGIEGSEGKSIDLFKGEEFVPASS